MPDQFPSKKAVNVNIRKRDIPPELFWGRRGKFAVGFGVPLVYFPGTKIAREDPQRKHIIIVVITFMLHVRYL